MLCSVSVRIKRRLSPKRDLGLSIHQHNAEINAEINAKIRATERLFEVFGSNVPNIAGVNKMAISQLRNIMFELFILLMNYVVA